MFKFVKNNKTAISAYNDVFSKLGPKAKLAFETIKTGNNKLKKKEQKRRDFLNLIKNIKFNNTFVSNQNNNINMQ